MMARKCSADAVFWGGVVGLSSVILASCYYLYSLLPEGESEGDERGDIVIEKDNVVDEEALIRLIIKIDQLADKFYERDYKREDINRRSIMSTAPNEYIELCKEKIVNKDFLTKIATEKVLSQLKTQVSLEKFQGYFSQIPLKRLEKLTIKHYEFNKDEELPSIETGKAVFRFYFNLFVEKMHEIEDKYRRVPKTDSSNQEKAIDLMITKVVIDDHLVLKYSIDSQAMNMILSKANCFNTDNNLKLLKDELDKYEKMLG